MLILISTTLGISINADSGMVSYPDHRAGRIDIGQWPDFTVKGNFPDSRNSPRASAGTGSDDYGNLHTLLRFLSNMGRVLIYRCALRGPTRIERLVKSVHCRAVVDPCDLSQGWIMSQELH